MDLEKYEKPMLEVTILDDHDLIITSETGGGDFPGMC